MRIQESSGSVPSYTCMELPRPLGDRVLVRQEAPQEKIGSLYIPDVADKVYPPIGEILRLGPKVGPDCPPVGSRVLFKRRPSSALVQDDRVPDQNEDWKDMVMLREEDILGEVMP